MQMFVNCSPALYNAPETLCSLNFAKRCRAVELGAAKKNSDSAEVIRLRKQIRHLQEDMDAIRGGEDDDEEGEGASVNCTPFNSATARFGSGRHRSKTSSLGPRISKPRSLGPRIYNIGAQPSDKKDEGASAPGNSATARFGSERLKCKTISLGPRTNRTGATRSLGPRTNHPTPRSPRPFI